MMYYIYVQNNKQNIEGDVKQMQKTTAKLKRK